MLTPGGVPYNLVRLIVVKLLYFKLEGRKTDLVLLYTLKKIIKSLQVISLNFRCFYKKAGEENYIFKHRKSYLFPVLFIRN